MTASVLDYLYVDLEKVISIYSQLTGGIVELRESHWTKNSTQDNKRKYDFKIFKHDAGGTTGDAEGGKVVIKAHHALLQDLEKELLSAGHLLDLSSVEDGLKAPNTRRLLNQTLCVRCRGRAVVEDYERIKMIALNFPNVVEFINRSSREAIKESDGYKALQRDIETAGDDLTDRNAKSRAKQAQKKLQRQLEEMVANASSVGEIDKWILDGMKTWIDAFLPGITNIRIYPAGMADDEHVFGNLKRSNFTEVDEASFQFTYGSVPTHSLTLLGVVTAVPSPDEDSFDPLSEFRKGELADAQSVESAFRGVFRGFDGIESLIRTCRYPRVLVHPLLVYREAQPNKVLQSDQHSVGG